MSPSNVEDVSRQDAREEIVWRWVSAPLYLAVDFGRTTALCAVGLCGAMMGMRLIGGGLGAYGAELVSLYYDRVAAVALLALASTVAVSAVLLTAEFALDRRWRRIQARRERFPGPWA